MRRIILHTPEPRSAAARYVWELVTALTLEGAKIHVVCPENFQFLGDFAGNPNIVLHLTCARSTSNRRNLLTRIVDNLRFLASSWAGLVKNGRRGDVVHFQFVLHFPFGALFFLTAKLRGCKIVFTVHDPLPHKWLLPEFLRWLERGALAWAYRASQTLIVHSEPGKRALIEHFGQKSHKISVIAHGPYDLGSGPLPMPDSDCLELLMFGSLRQNKGLHLAIAAVQLLHEEGLAVRLTIAGDVPNAHEQDHWDDCVRLIARNPEPVRVFQEFVPDDKLPQLFGACHAVLLPYTQFYSDSGVASMALANGRPIIATQSGGLGVLMESANLAVTIKEPSVAAVAAAIREALKLTVAGLALRGMSGAEYVNVWSGWDRIAAQTCAVYSRHLGAEKSHKLQPFSRPRYRT